MPRNPLDPKEWLARAKSNLLQAKHHQPGIYFEDLLFLAQQSVEKALKAYLLKNGLQVPHTHNVTRLITEVKKHARNFPQKLETVAWLTDFSVAGRYPNLGEPVTREEYLRGLTDAAEIIAWVEHALN